VYKDTMEQPGRVRETKKRKFRRAIQGEKNGGLYDGFVYAMPYIEQEKWKAALSRKGLEHSLVGWCDKYVHDE